MASPESAELGVVYDRESNEPWPDLVCDACSSEPEWTDEQAAQRFRVLCSYCWEDAFGRNTRARSSGPQEWMHDALHRTERRQDRWTGRFDIMRAARYRYGLEDTPPWLGFGPTEGVYDVMCEPVVLGSWSSRSGTWLWGWANDWWQPGLTSRVVRVKRTAERMGIEPLWRSLTPGDEALGWEMSAAAFDLMPEYEGVYRAPTQNGALFLAVRNSRRVH